MEEFKKFLEEIGIVQKGTMSDDGCYVIDFSGDLEWSKAQSKLDQSNLVEEEEDSTNIAIDSATIQYVNDTYNITVTADFDSDQYKLIMRKV